MNRLPIVAGAATILVVAVGGGILLGQRNQPAIGGPTASAPSSATASPTSSPSAAEIQVPRELRYYWVGVPRPVPGLTTHDRYRFKLNVDAIAFPDDNLENPELASSVTAPTTDTLEMVTTDSTAGCFPGEIGRYRWSLSPGGARLTLAASGTDTCTARAAALPGDWFRVACSNYDSGCLGPLEAGTFASQYVDPTLPNGNDWRPDWGALTYTVPAGWSNSIDWPHTYSLTPTVDYGKEGPDAPRPSQVHRIVVWANPMVVGLDAECVFEGLDDTFTVAGMVSAIKGLPTLDAGEPHSITIGGRSGSWVDVRVDPASTACASSTEPRLSFHTRTQLLFETDPLDLVGETRERVILLDLGGGSVVLIAIQSGDPTRFDELVAEAMPIIETFRFK